MNEQKYSITGTAFSEQITIEIKKDSDASIEKLKEDAHTLHFILNKNIPSKTYYELKRIFLLEILEELKWKQKNLKN